MPRAYYVQFFGKLPRKRKEQRFEIRLIGESPLAARELIVAYCKQHGIKQPRAACLNQWEVSESSYKDANGNAQVLVMRSMFPCGASIAVPL